MSFDPTQKAPKDLQDLPMPQIIADAMEKWSDLTGVGVGQTRFRLGEIEVREMNEILKEMLALEPEGTTALMLLECILRAYLESKTFSAAVIMRDYAATTDWLSRAAELFSIVQSDRAVAELAAFRARLFSALAHYRVDREDVREVVQDADIMPFLRRDALKSIESLQPYQFLAGEADMGHPQVIEHVYMAWDINQLLVALRDMPVSGIAVVLLRDPANPERSYFAFAMRNGGNVILFTDKRKPVFPGQEDVLAAHSSRGTGRAYMKRAWSNHFPYQLIKTSLDDRGDVVFDDETSPVMAGLNLVPLMRIKDLPPHQTIWLSMMLSLISEKFWKKSWRAEALSYTGDMVRKRNLLVSDHAGDLLPAAAGYRPITLDTVSVDELTFEAMLPQVRTERPRVNAWLEERYAPSVDQALLNLWFAKKDEMFLLPSTDNDPWRFGRAAPEVKDALSCGAVSVTKERQRGFDKLRGYGLLSFAPTEFGTEAELKADRLFIARHNLAQHIQKSADEEFGKRSAEIQAWYLRAVRAHQDGLLDLLSDHLAGHENFGALRDGHRRILYAEIGSTDWRYVYDNYNMLGEHAPGSSCKPTCVLTGVASLAWRAKFTPTCAQDLAVLTGLEISELPDVLRHWLYEKPYTGNNLLDRIDPVESQVHNPWSKLHLSVNLYLSKRGNKMMLDRAAAASS